MKREKWIIYDGSREVTAEKRLKEIKAEIAKLEKAEQEKTKNNKKG